MLDKQEPIEVRVDLRSSSMVNRRVLARYQGPSLGWGAEKGRRRQSGAALVRVQSAPEGSGNSRTPGV